MNTKMLHYQRHKYNTNASEAGPCKDDQVDRKGYSGALLDMLAEVASQTLHSDPSVKSSPIKRSTKTTAESSYRSSNRKKRMTCRSRSGEGNTMDLEHVRSLTANHLLKLFSEFDGDEIRRIFTFTCFMEPEQCHQQFSSFGSEGKARQQMKSHLLEHVHQLELKTECGFPLTAESIKVRQHRLSEKYAGSSRRHKLSSRMKVEQTVKSEPSDENDSNLHNKENTENCALMKQNVKLEKLCTHKEGGNLNNSNNKNGMEAESTEDISGAHDDKVVAEKVCDVEGKSNSSENCHGIYEEHSYAILVKENSPTDVPTEGHRECAWSESKISEIGCEIQNYEKQEKIKEESVLCAKDLTADLGTFMMAETCDMVMVCVMEDNKLQLKQLPYVGQEIDVETYQSPFSYKMIRSDELPVVQDNRKAEPQKYSDELSREVNCEKNIERDEYIQKKKPKGKAKFIGQSKAEKEMAIHLIEVMKRKGSADSLECYICNPPRSFTAPTTLISHYRSHAGIKPYECRICHSVFTRQHSLNYHMLIHSNQTRFTCADCGRKFRHPSHFKEHRRRHTGESPYECSDCMLRFKTRNTYKRHLKTRHGKVLTTSGGLIILSEEEFRRVRTLPRSPHSSAATQIKQDLHSGKKRSRKVKGRFKIDGNRRRLEHGDMMNEEDEEDIEEDVGVSFNKETCLEAAVTGSVPTNTDDDDDGDGENQNVIGLQNTSCVSNAKSKFTLPLVETEPPQKSFQDIVEEAMKQSNISFSDDPENNKANVVVLDVPVTGSENVYTSKDGTFESQQENTQQLSVPPVSIKNNWNTVNVHMKRFSKGNVCTVNQVHQQSVYKSNNNNIAQFLPNICKDSLILPNAIGFNSLPVNTGIHQTQALSTVLSSNEQTPTFSSFTSSSEVAEAIQSPQFEVNKKNLVSTHLVAEGLNGVESDRSSVISADSQQATVMLLAEDGNTSLRYHIKIES